MGGCGAGCGWVEEGSGEQFIASLVEIRVDYWIAVFFALGCRKSGLCIMIAVTMQIQAQNTTFFHCSLSHAVKQKALLQIAIIHNFPRSTFPS